MLQFVLELIVKLWRGQIQKWKKKMIWFATEQNAIKQELQ